MTQLEGNPELDRLIAGRSEIDLVQFMIELAADVYPNVDRVGCLLEIDRLGAACREHDVCRYPSSIRERLSAISELLYGVEGFHGNRDAYYEPENSYLNEVLARRCGIPISLGILYMAIAARAGLKMFGVNTPGHFVIGCACGGETLFVDPFTNGDVLDQSACKCRIQQTLGSGCSIDNEHFRAAGTVEVAARVLRNLKAAYAMRDEWRDVLRVQRRLTALVPHCMDERRDLGLVYLRVGEPTKALPALEQYLNSCGSQQRAALQPSLQAARRMIAELN